LKHFKEDDEKENASIENNQSLPTLPSLGGD
jgi:hypothetical protein